MKARASVGQGLAKGLVIEVVNHVEANHRIDRHL